jgi:hypothetical protein
MPMRVKLSALVTMRCSTLLRQPCPKRLPERLS